VRANSDDSSSFKDIIKEPCLVSQPWQACCILTVLFHLNFTKPLNSWSSQASSCRLIINMLAHEQKCIGGSRHPNTCSSCSTMTFPKYHWIIDSPQQTTGNRSTWSDHRLIIVPHTTGAIQNPSSSGQSVPGASFNEVIQLWVSRCQCSGFWYRRQICHLLTVASPGSSYLSGWFSRK